MTQRQIVQGAAAVVALCLILVGGGRVLTIDRGLMVEPLIAGPVPATLYQPANAEPGPLVIIAHGFAGSQQLMQPFAVTLARRGYSAVTFDFPGHGRHPDPLPDGVDDYDALEQALFNALTTVEVAARSHVGDAAGLALVGHSMAADVAVKFAMAHPRIDATVAVSLFFNAVSADHPRNLQVIYGAFEPEMLVRQGRAVVDMAAPEGQPATANVTYGSFVDGTARRLILAGGVEHIGVLYSADSLTAAAAWLDAAFGRDGNHDSPIDRRGGDLALMFLGLVLLAWPLSTLLPRITTTCDHKGDRRRPALGWRPLLAGIAVPMLATPLILRPMPTDFLPILLGDYLTLHFGLYGVITAGMLVWFARRGYPVTGGWRVAVKPALVVGGLVLMYGAVVLG